MSQEQAPAPRARRGWIVYGVTILVAGAACAAVTALLMNIRQRKEEGQHPYVRLVELDEDSVDPEQWRTNFPRQYDGYARTVDTSRTKYGGSEALNRLKLDPRLPRMFAGYPFAVDYSEERGHAYMLSDQDATLRTKPPFKQTGACLHCHASVIPAYRKAGGGDIMAGFKAVNAMPLAEARKLVNHPVTCLDCHDPKSIRLRVTRPGFLEGIAALAAGQGEVPHLPSIERWRRERKGTYDPNTMATRQEMRTFVCAQCHVEYYFKGPEKRVTYPWANGLKMEQIEAYYDHEKFSDWKHKETDAEMLKAQHPEFEMWSQGTHARSGVACADCHMPYVREGAMKVSDHHVRSPLLNVNRACQTCHRFDESEILARARAIQDRNAALLERAEIAVIDLMDAIQVAKGRKSDAAALDRARALHRKAQWRADFVNAENSMGFHAPQEAARVLGEAIDYARQGQVEVFKAMAK